MNSRHNSHCSHNQRSTHQIKPFIITMFLLQMVSTVGFGYMFSQLTEHLIMNFHFAQKQAYTFYAAFLALSYTTPVIGGYLAEKFLGYIQAIYISILLSVFGFVCLAFNSIFLLHVGAGLIAFATGLMVPSLFVILGFIYSDTGSRDGGFTISYIGMNTGSLISFFCFGILSQHINYELLYLICALVTLFMIPLTYKYSKLLKTLVSHHSDKVTTKNAAAGWLILIFSQILVIIFISYMTICKTALFVFAFAALIYILHKSIKSKAERKKMLAFLVLIIISIAFWASYLLLGSALDNFIIHNVDNYVLHIYIPSSSIIALNPLLIIIIGFTFSWLWSKNTRSKFSLPYKFSCSVILMGASYVILTVGILLHNQTGQTSFIWVLISYIFQTCGELLIAPIGFAMVSYLIAKKHQGSMMGVLQLSTGLASVISGYIAISTIPQKAVSTHLMANGSYEAAFLKIGVFTLLLGLVFLLFSPKLNKMIS